MTRAGDAFFELRRMLAASPTADLDAALLLAHVLGCSRAALAAAPERELDEAQSAALAALATRRSEGEPVAYLTGRRGFWTLDLEVTPDVLVPRPETELWSKSRSTSYEPSRGRPCSISAPAAALWRLQSRANGRMRR